MKIAVPDRGVDACPAAALDAADAPASHPTMTILPGGRRATAARAVLRVVPLPAADRS
jgi:hypothetical protein